MHHSVLERGRIGQTWRTQRWDSFRMNTPNVQTVMPGDRYEGPDPYGVHTRDQFVALLEDFAGRNGLPIEADTAVSELAQENGAYRLTTSHGTLRARNVIVASGNLNCPVRPISSDALPPDICQIDASGYRSAAHLPGGAVLVVGSGQSGAQIAEELAEAGRTVFLATRRVGAAPTALPGARRHDLARGKRTSRRAARGGHSACGTHPAAWCVRVGAHDKPSGARRPGYCASRAIVRRCGWRPPLVRRRCRSKCSLWG
ncbi:NAD(P)-binding domain-containing protein [Rhizobium mongolense]|uniref:NAD(P)-binding domain-containing protein n=1 Tax=Rhizobium mongolense TaxID=57676 RepID=UPI001F240951|nr:NAD(P)-binding domain-containing protein [Rhizobium mongolense]